MTLSDLPTVTELFSDEVEIKPGPLALNLVFFVQYPWASGSALSSLGDKKKNMPDTHRVDVFLAQHQSCKQSSHPFCSDAGDSWGLCWRKLTTHIH